MLDTPHADAQLGGSSRTLSLPDGRTVLVLGKGGQKEIEVRSPQGELKCAA